MGRIKEDFDSILEQQRIKPVYQPVVSLKTGEVIGYEALSRISSPTEISNTEELFHLADIYGKVWELEQICRGKILEKYHRLQRKENRKLFLNVNPMVIHDKEFRSGFTSGYLNRYGLDMENIVFEVTERNSIDDMKGFKETIRHYKSQGYQIAVDDAGSCYSGLNLICDVVPHYLKLDIELIRGIQNDTIKYAMVNAMVEFADLTNIQLIAEGIECEEELKTLLKLGVHNGQGYFLGRPAEELKETEAAAVEMIQKYNAKRAEKIKKMAAGNKEFRAVLFQFDSYKSYAAYCEKYGDEEGDKLIGVMQQVIEQNLLEGETAVQVSEDGILAVLEKEHYKFRTERIATVFRNRIREYYQKEDIEKGYLAGTNKHGESRKYPLLALESERVI